MISIIENTELNLKLKPVLHLFYTSVYTIELGMFIVTKELLVSFDGNQQV